MEFALGMGPKLFSKKRGETVYSLRAIPIGGFCAMEGEDGGSEDEAAFSNKPAWKRFIVLVAGAVMNIILGFILLVASNGMQDAYRTTAVQDVQPGYAAEAAGIRTGDELIRVNKTRIHISSDLFWAVSRLDDKRADFTVRRGGEKLTFTLEPKDGEPYGLSFSEEKMTAIGALRISCYETGFYSKVILESLIDLLKGRVSVNEMSGPVGIVAEIGGAVKESVETGMAGIERLLGLTILLTINLGIFNLLPIPALDGGRILFVLIELVTRKKLPPEKEGIVHMIGFALLMLLAIFIAYMDVLKLFK